MITPARRRIGADTDRTGARDRGSAIPLILGLVVALLLLGGGVTAATSAVLARNSLRHTCDGAAAAAVDAAQRTRLLEWGGSDLAAATTAATDYLRQRGSTARASIALDGTLVRLECADTAPVTWGALFGVDTVDLAVASSAAPVL